jgi:hypothetical protein
VMTARCAQSRRHAVTTLRGDRVALSPDDRAIR